MDFRFEEISGEPARKSLSDLLGAAFSLKPKTSFFDDFPVWDEKFGAAETRRLGAWNGQTLTSCACARLARLRAGSGVFTVAIIGAVATHAQWRGQGLASQLVSSLTEWARGRGATAAFLWGSEHEMYRKLGFALDGIQLRTPLADLELAPGSEVHRGWTPALLGALAESRVHGGLELTEPDRPWISAHKNVEWYWTGDTGRITAYAGYGRGVDLTDIVHEWGGETAALRWVLGEVRRIHPKATLLTNPSHSARFGFPTSNSIEESLALAQVWDDRLRDVWLWGLDAA